MFQQQVDRKVVIIVAAVVAVVVVAGFMGYNRFQGKQVENLTAKRDWQVNREMGIPLSMESQEANMSPEERKQARKAALEQSRWGGESAVENTVPSPPQ
ncbi:hypothetical protein EON83_04170 [bacterium]|nr:MAG: hypothetical protein EON83_04170 [bacterium]